MADLSNNSFIPKRGPVKRPRGTATRQVYLFTIVSYVVMFATLLSVGGVYLYGEYIDGLMEKEVVALNSAINSFNTTDLQRVLEFDSRLSQASGRLNSSVSIVSVFDALESATIDTVQITSLNLERVNDDKFLLSAVVETDSFDSTIFQRGVFQRDEVVESVVISETQTQSESESSEIVSTVSFTAELTVPLMAVPYVGTASQNSSPVPPINIDIDTEPVELPTLESDDFDGNNEDNI